MTRQWWQEVCPVCAMHGGFHDDGPHEVARSRIPRKLILQPGWHRRTSYPEPWVNRLRLFIDE